MGPRSVIAPAALLCAVSCTETTGPNLSGVPGYMINTVRVSPSIDTIFVPDVIRPTDRITFTATATGKNGGTLSDLTFAWSTSNPSIATVDSAGVVTPLSTGVVEIIASADKIGRATLVILPATMSVSVTLAIDTILVALPIVPTRDTLRLSATARDLSGVVLPGVFFEWASSSPLVATVDATGLVTAKTIGTTTVSASANGHVGAAVVHVLAAAPVSR